MNEQIKKQKQMISGYGVYLNGSKALSSTHNS